MKITDLKQGKKYYHTFSTQLKTSRGGPKQKTTSIIRVIAINLDDRKILASVNCFPAQWYPDTICKHWTETNLLVTTTLNPLS